MKEQLFRLTDGMGIPKRLVIEYSDEFDPETSQYLFGFLSLPQIRDSLGRIRNGASLTLYRGFVEELLENSYAFRKFDEYKYFDAAEKLLPIAQELIRKPEKRTPQSNQIKDYAISQLQPCVDQLRQLGIVCFLHGSALYGDAVDKSDADLIFCVQRNNPEVYSLIRRMEGDFKSNPSRLRNIDVAIINDLEQILEKLEAMKSRRVTSIGQYSIYGGDILLGNVGWLSLIYGEKLNEVSPAFSKSLDETKTALHEAIRRDAIINFIIAYHAAINIQLRQNRLKQ